MKKPVYVALALLVAASMVLLSAGQSQAAFGDHKCYNCHTMHNSEGGEKTAYTLVDGAISYLPDEGNAALVKGDCVACHSTTTGTAYVTGGTPFVFTVSPTGSTVYGENDLAGGNFYYLINPVATGVRAGHNIEEISGVGIQNFTAPPGFMQSPNPTSISGNWGPTDWNDLSSNPLTCAGIYGCHGDRTKLDPMEAISGTHHDSRDWADVGGDDYHYRLLYGIKAWGADDFELLKTTEHNVYYANDDGVAADHATISFLCSECHGNFHSAADLGGPKNYTGGTTLGPWKRHPSDLAFSNTATWANTDCEYKSYNNSQGAGSFGPYSPYVPVGFINATAADVTNFTIGTNDPCVMCISCHRAHASANQHMMRWPYHEGVLGEGAIAQPDPATGVSSCRTCHTNK